MADFTALKTAIQNAIKQNGNEEITGNLLQDVLLAIVTTLGDGSINDLINALGSEATTRSQADGTLQQNINAEAQARQQAVSAEAQARQLADSTLQGGINTAMQAINAINNAITNGCVYAGIATPSSIPASGKVFYLALTAGTYTNYGGLEVSQGINILKNNGSTWSLDSFVGIDDAPAPSSQKLVKSGGVFDEVMKNGSAFDLSAYNGGATYADLNAALTALNALPAAYKRGGMSMKFVLSSDNKYVQYRLMAQTFSTTESDWQGVDEEPSAGSDNLVKSGGVWSTVDGLRENVQKNTIGIFGEYIRVLADCGVINGKFMNSLGTISDSSSYSYAFVDVSNLQTVRIVADNIQADSAVVNTCDDTKTFISNLSNWTSIGTITYKRSQLPVNTKYLCISVKTADISKVSITISGDSLSQKTSFLREELIKADDKIYGNELSIDGTSTFNALNPSTINGIYFDAQGGEHSGDTYSSSYVYVKDYEKFVVSGNGLSSEVLVNACDDNKNFVANIASWVTLGTIERSVVDLSPDVCYLCISAKTLDISKINVSVISQKGMAPINFSINGGTQNKSLNEYIIRNGSYMNYQGVETTSAPYCYTYIDIENTDKVVLNGDNIAEGSVVLNFYDSNYTFVSNLINWGNLDNLTILSESLSQNIRFIGLSCKIIDIDKISITLNYPGLINDFEKYQDEASSFMARYDAAYSKAINQGKKFIKGVFLDAGRKYFNVGNIKTLIDEIVSARLNTLCLYFSDHNGFRFGLNNMTVNVNGESYDLSVALGDGIAPTDGTNKWLTESEMDEIISYAKTNGVELIPAFDMPGHMAAIRQDFSGPDFSESTKAGRNWMVAVFDKYVSYFASKGCRYFNVCGDEYSGGTQEDYVKIMTRLMRCITYHSMIPLIYNDMICKNGYNVPYIDNGAIVIGWIYRNGSMANYSTIVNSGYKMLNGNNNPFYWTLGSTVVTPELIQSIKTASIFLMADGSVNKDIAGVMYHIWCDQADADGADEGDNVIAQTASCIEAFGYNVSHSVPTDILPEDELYLRANNGSIYKLTVSNNGEINTQIVS